MQISVRLSYLQIQNAAVVTVVVLVVKEDMGSVW